MKIVVICLIFSIVSIDSCNSICCQLHAIQEITTKENTWNTLLGFAGGATDQFSANLMPFAGAEKVIFFREDEKYFRELL